MENNIKISKKLLQRFLRKENYCINIATKKALLNKDKAKKRLGFLKESNKKIRNIKLIKVVFLDKAAIKRGKGGRREYYRNCLLYTSDAADE